MATHHQHCHHQNSHPTTATTTFCCCATTCTPSHHPPPPDPLLHSISSHLLHPPPPQPHLHSPYLNPPCNPNNHQTHYYPPQPLQQLHQFGLHRQQQDPTHPIVSSLLRRITALESAFRHHSSASYSLRDTAARTIQTHFRAFLVRRSRTLRQLKDLASIKSTLNTLKSSMSGNTRSDSRSLSHKAMNLLLKLDSIQGDDPMIRNGKKSISRELIRFMEVIDGVSVRTNDLSSRTVKNVRFGGNGGKSRVLYSDHRVDYADFSDLGVNHRKTMRKLRGQVERIHGFSRVSEEDEELENRRNSMIGNCGVPRNRSEGLVKRHDEVQSKAKKSVRFAENANVYRVFRSSHEPISNGDSNSTDGSDSIDNDERELLDNLCREVEDIGVSSKETEDDEEAHIEDAWSPQVSDGENEPRGNLRTEGNYKLRRLEPGEDGTLVFSAPLPVKMEARADLMNKRKTLTVVK